MTPRRRPAQAPVPAVGYAPGHFLALVQRHAWPPRFEPQLALTSHTDALRTRAAQLGRDMAKAQGLGWGNGTIPMNGTPGRLPPGNMGVRHAAEL